MNVELERTWKKASVLYCKVLPQHFREGPEKNREVSHHSWSVSQEFRNFRIRMITLSSFKSIIYISVYIVRSSRTHSVLTHLTINLV
jgi:hypothetical protein